MDNKANKWEKKSHHHEGHNWSAQNKAKRIGFGFLLLLAGGLFILRNLDLLPNNIDNILISWQMLVIAIGFVKFLFDPNKAVGGIMILVGGFFLIPELFEVSIDFVDVFWPLLLIGAGLIVIFGPGRKLIKGKSEHPNDARYIEEMNVFGGNEKLMEVKNFKGGSIHNIFGGTELDMRDCDMEGDSAEIEVFCVFGGLEMRVPDNWEVIIKVTPIFGGFSNKRSSRPVEGSEKKTLFINGTVVFGGGEIK